ncbi:MAG: PDZ domain-containing protein [Anaerolineae bacterium]|nr:PDZ domain-containing protein [Anaerolineae bacterium]
MKLPVSRTLPVLLAAIILPVLACGPIQDVVQNLGSSTPEAEPTTPPATYPPSINGEIPLANIIGDEGGPVLVRGTVAYTNPFFTEGVAQPLIILEDQTGFVDRNKDYIIPVDSQVLGQITTDFYTSPFDYELELPSVPDGTYRDVDHNGQADQGVMVFAVAYWTNIWGDPYLEERDLYGGGWSTAYASTRVSSDPAPEQEMEIVGGSYIVYASDDQQGFPSGFGADGLLFTEDDPIVRLPAGYTIVNMDSAPFTYSRPREATLELFEPEDSALVDYSDQSYAEAFDSMVEKFRTEYAFTEYKNIDWDALSAEFRPRFEEAERRNDEEGYGLALWEFIQRIPDGHVYMAEWNPSVLDRLREALGGGIGMAVREVEGGSIIASFILPGGPADTAGIQHGATIVTINGSPAEDFVNAVVPWLGPFGTDHTRRLGQLHEATRFPVGDTVRITYRNPGGGEATASLTAINEWDSWDAFSGIAAPNGYELPVQYQVLDSGIVYVQITSFLDNDLLSIQLWERMIQQMNNDGMDRLIIDMRQNGGGSGFLADQMAAYFFNQPLVIGNTAYYSESLGEFYVNPDSEEKFILPPEDLRFNGQVAVLIGPDCASACEFFSYDMTLQDRATIVGFYPTAGMGGSVEYFDMPGGTQLSFTIGRGLDAEGNIHIEGIGVVPDVPVPLTAENLLSDGDPVLEAAITALGG